MLRRTRGAGQGAPEIGPRTALADRVFSQLALAVPPVEIEAGRRSALWARIAAKAALPPPGTRTVHEDALDWIVVNDAVRLRVLRQDRATNSQTVLIRLDAGGIVVPHRHTQEEECYVISGEIEIGTHRVRAGEMHVAGPGSRHERILARQGALLLIRSEIPPVGFSIV
jgi:quercetin dioxygenase-like cupin family protein